MQGFQSLEQLKQSNKVNKKMMAKTLEPFILNPTLNYAKALEVVCSLKIEKLGK